MRSPAIISGILDALVIFAASIYAILAIMGQVEANIPIFIAWLAALNFFNGSFIFLLWRQRSFFSYSHRALVLLWAGVSVWYWSFAPIYYLLNMNLDSEQLAWTMFAYFWEVPIIGGLLFVSGAYFLFGPIKRYFEGSIILKDPLAFYKMVLRYPIWAACMMYAIAVIGYQIGTLQLAYFSNLSFVEQIKNTLNGFAVSVFIVIVFYLLLHQFISPVRAKIKNQYASSYVFPRAKFLNRTIATSSLVVIGVLALIALISFKSFQDDVYNFNKLILADKINQLKADLFSAGSNEEMSKIADDFRAVNKDKIILIGQGESLDEYNFSRETVDFFNASEEGYVNDFKKNIKLVGFWKGPSDVGAIVLVVPLAPFYSQLLESIYRLFAGISFVLLLTIPLVVFISFITTRGITLLITYLISKRPEEINKEFGIYTGDEVEELSHAIAGYATTILESQALLQKRVDEATQRFQDKVVEVEANNEYLQKTKTATLNLLEDLDSAKARLEEGKLKDEAILSSIGDGMLVVDEAERLIIVNQRAEDMLGFNASEMLGKKWYDIITLQTENGEVLPVLERPIHQVFATQDRVSILPLITPSKTYYFVRKNKTRFPVEIVVSPIILNGKMLGAVEVFRDITREKEIEKVKTEFVSIASHQLRTPLSTINWYSEILLSGDAGPITADQKEYLGEIFRGNQRMIDLVNALLNVSRLEVGAFIIEAKAISLEAVAKDVLNESKPQIVQKNIIVEEKYSSNLPMVFADYSLARIILQNLINNSIKYTLPGGKIGVEIELKEDGMILIKVRDTGIGIPKLQQDKVFTKLFRADNARERDPDGTGLGLYIIKSIIDQTNGKIWFESEEGKGTTFYISIPTSWMQSKTGTRKLI